MTRKQLYQKLGLAEGTPLAERMARYRTFAFDADPGDASAMALDLEQSGDPEAASLARKLRRFAGDDDGGGGTPADAHETLARKLGVESAATPDEIHEALGRFAQTCKMKFAEDMDDPAALARLMGELDDVLSHEGAESMDAYGPEFEGLKRLARRMRRFAGEPEDPTTMADDAPPPSLMSDDPEGDAIIHGFARRRGIDLRTTPRAVILGAMVAEGQGAGRQADIDARVQAALAAERLKEQRRATEERAERLFTMAVKCGFSPEAKAGFMAMARTDPSAAEKVVRGLPGAKALTRMTTGGEPLSGRVPRTTPQMRSRGSAGPSGGGGGSSPDPRRANVDLAERAEEMVEAAKTDVRIMNRLTRRTGGAKEPGMLLAVAQQIVAEEDPGIVEWAAEDQLFDFGPDAP